MFFFWKSVRETKKMWFLPHFCCHKLVTIYISNYSTPWNNRIIVFFSQNESKYIICDIHEQTNHEIMFDSTEIRDVWAMSPTSEFFKLCQFPDIVTLKKYFFTEECKTKVFWKWLGLVHFQVNLLTHCQSSIRKKNIEINEFFER